MNRLPRLAAVLTATALTTVVLAGCSGAATPAPTVTVTVTPGPTTTPTSTTTGTATPEPASAKSVTLDADGIVVSASEGTINAGYFDGVTPAVNALTVAFGSVQPTFLPAGKCNADQTTYDWGAVKLTYLGSDASAASTFILSASTAPTTVDVSTALGARVGGSWKSYIANLPSSALTRDDGTYQDALESATPGGSSSTVGTVVTATNGAITGITVPIDFNADC
ncbi:hypothetical protein [Subtercola lobariae]|uniref:hypothetical protein n=1 Tax=Subtercola lobariae TaxID=1588641 RepID=UPI0016665AA1|nr:hypothetical protein [Subtercola lobariae]